MKIVQYGDWKIAVDVDETKQYYSKYKIIDTSANRNYAEYCKIMSEEEKNFFSSFGINPICCDIEHIGVSRKGEFPCGGYYLVHGSYLEYPSENLISIEELAENDFIDDRPDPRIDIGIFQFDFQHEDYEIKDIPEDIPEGYICIRFWCEDMKWIIDEPCDVKMYEPPRFWEIHKKINEIISHKKEEKDYRAKQIKELEDMFCRLNISYAMLTKKEVGQYKKKWLEKFAPDDVKMKELRKLCLSSHKYSTFLWHVFSWGYLECVEGDEADNLYCNSAKDDCVILINTDSIAYRMINAEALTHEILKKLIDVTVTSSDFSWTYTKTHEEVCGPYFYENN